MTGRFLLRVLALAIVLSLVLGAIVWWKPAQTKEEKWRFYQIGRVDPSTGDVFTSLTILHPAGSPLDINAVAQLPSSLAYLPKKADPLFGQSTADAKAKADMVVEPAQCLLIKTILVKNGTDVVLTVEAAHPAPDLTKLTSKQSGSCTSTGECTMMVWAEARPKKCD